MQTPSGKPFVPPTCHQLHGQPIDLTKAILVFYVFDNEKQGITEYLGRFEMPGADDPTDFVQFGICDTPIGSKMAQLAHRIDKSPGYRKN